MIYAGFWKRSVALLVDGLLLTPLSFIFVMLDGVSRPMALLSALAFAVVAYGYEVGCVARWGQTLGKYAVGIRVVRSDGSRVGWREAWLRSSVDLGFACILFLGDTSAIVHAPASLWTDVGWMVRQAKLQAARPDAIEFVAWVQMGWLLGEVVSVLFNEKKRSLHDYIAGTVVIVEAPLAVPVDARPAAAS